jgi:hypothetical protein
MSEVRRLGFKKNEVFACCWKVLRSRRSEVRCRKIGGEKVNGRNLDCKSFILKHHIFGPLTSNFRLKTTDYLLFFSSIHSDIYFVLCAV